MINLPAFLDGTTTAACATHPNPDLWHSTATTDQNQAKIICRTCPLRPACATHALTTPEPRSTWGGLTAPERRRLLRPDDPQHLDDDGRLRHPCGEYKALLAHIAWGETCEKCRTAQDKRTRAGRLERLKVEHAAGGTERGARIHRLLGERACPRCRAGEARRVEERRQARQQQSGPASLALAS